jgi:uncharacterized protein
MSSNGDEALGHPAGKAGSSSLRRLWVVKLLVFFGVLLAGDIAAQLGRIWAIRRAPAGSADSIAVAASVVFAAALLAVYLTLVRWMERRQPSELAPDAIGGVSGAILGVGLFASVFGLLHLSAVAQWQGMAAHFDVAPMLAASILAAVGEELAFRGALFRILEESFGTATALVVSAAFFGLLHALNPGANIVSTTAIALEAGALLAASYTVTRNLWFPIGLHLGWNFTEGGIFGVSVSGARAGEGIFSVSLSGPDLLTGGKFGPEASVVAIGVCLAAAVALLILAVRNGRWIAMGRRELRSAAS